MARPAGSYRGARRNEAKRTKKPMITYAELLRVNSLRTKRMNSAKGDDK